MWYLTTWLQPHNYVTNKLSPLGIGPITSAARSCKWLGPLHSFRGSQPVTQGSLCIFVLSASILGHHSSPSTFCLANALVSFRSDFLTAQCDQSHQSNLPAALVFLWYTLHSSYPECCTVINLLCGCTDPLQLPILAWVILRLSFNLSRVTSVLSWATNLTIFSFSLLGSFRLAWFNLNKASVVSGSRVHYKRVMTPYENSSHRSILADGLDFPLKIRYWGLPSASL